MGESEKWMCDLGDRTSKTLVVTGPLGSGTVARVFAASWLGLPVAIKQLRPLHEIQDPSTRANAEADFRTEAAVNRALGCHPNVVGFYGTCLIPAQNPDESADNPERRLGIVFERIGDGASIEASYYGMHSHSYLVRTLSVALGVARGLAHAHGKGFMHRDVKLSNVMVSPTGSAKICDWGLATRSDDPQKSPRTGTNEYMAPEVFLCASEGGPSSYDEKADVFSFSIFFCALLTGEQHPYHASYLTPDQIVQAVAEKNLRPQITSALKEKPELVDILEKAWATNPADRPDMEEVALSVLSVLHTEQESESKSTEVHGHSHHVGLGSWFSLFSIGQA